MTSLHVAMMHANGPYLNDFQKSALSGLEAIHSTGTEPIAAAFPLSFCKLSIQSAESLKVTIDEYLTNTNWLTFIQERSEDQVMTPQHYSRFPMEPTWYLTMSGYDSLLYNVGKYIFRYPFKSVARQDLSKSSRYLEMKIKFMNGDPEWSR